MDFYSILLKCGPSERRRECSKNGIRGEGMTDETVAAHSHSKRRGIHKK